MKYFCLNFKHIQINDNTPLQFIVYFNNSICYKYIVLKCILRFIKMINTMYK